MLPLYTASLSSTRDQQRAVPPAGWSTSAGTAGVRPRTRHRHGRRRRCCRVWRPPPTTACGCGPSRGRGRGHGPRPCSAPRRRMVGGGKGRGEGGGRDRERGIRDSMPYGPLKATLKVFAAVPGRPLGVRGVVSGAGAFIVSWAPPPRPGGRILSYTVKWRVVETRIGGGHGREGTSTVAGTVTWVQVSQPRAAATACLEAWCVLLLGTQTAL